MTVIPDDWTPPGASIYRAGILAFAIALFCYVFEVDRLIVLIAAIVGAVLVAAGLVVRGMRDG